MAGIRLKDIHKTYQVDGRTFPVLNGVDLEIPEGKITVILGQSGCGKTTLLRLTGGLESADSGEVRWDGAHKTAFVFQEPRLMPWLNVWNNIIFGLKKNQVDQEKIQDIVSTVNLSGFEKAYPSQLSGGMQQRAAIARALAYEPTHSIDEALILGDQIVVIEKGLVKHVYPVKAAAGARNLLDEEFIALKREIIEQLNFLN